MNTKHIKKLSDKKYRQETGLFIVEGEKNILELLESDFQIDELYITKHFLESHKDALEKYDSVRTFYTIVEVSELESFSTFQSNTGGLAIVKQRESKPFSLSEIKGYLIVLDSISDPGNLGTIIRLADWYGMSDMIASMTTTDAYNPKTIAASMGSFTRVNVHYSDLKTVLAEAKENDIPIFGTYLDGKDIHAIKFPSSGIIVMGSESHGISKELESLITDRITIPRHGHAESLNVSIATAIVLDNIKR